MVMGSFAERRGVMEPEVTKSDEILAGGVGKRLALVELPSKAGGMAATVPLAVITGSHDGPTVWVNAGLHGDEYLGPATVDRLLSELEPKAIRGRLILTPTLNPDGVRAMQRSDPAHPADLNRVWSAEHATRAGDAVPWAEAALLPHSDAILDLHSGGNRFLQHPFAVFPDVGGAVAANSAALAKACGFPWIWAHRDSILDHALITAAAREGKSAVLLELAGEGKAEPAWIEEMVAAVRGALAHVGALQGSPRYRPSYRVFERLEVVRNREEGLWRRSVEPGSPLRAGEALGTVLDLLGREREVVRSPREAAVAGICTYGYVPPEDYVAEIASGFHEEGPPA